MESKTGYGAFPHMTRPSVRIPVETSDVVRRIEVATRDQRNPYVRLITLEGVLERLITRLASAEDLADVNIAAGIAAQELSDAH